MERTSRRVTTDAVLIATARFYQIPVARIISKTRKREVMIPRQTVHYLCYRHATDSLASIAEATGLKHHATVIHSFQTVDDEKNLYPFRKQELIDIQHNLSEMGFNVGVRKSRKKRYTYTKQP